MPQLEGGFKPQATKYLSNVRSGSNPPLRKLQYQVPTCLEACRETRSCLAKVDARPRLETTELEPRRSGRQRGDYFLYMRHQSDLEFREELLRNVDVSFNELAWRNLFLSQEAQVREKVYPEEAFRWGTDSTFNYPRSLSLDFNEDKIADWLMRAAFRPVPMPGASNAGDLSEPTRVLDQPQGGDVDLRHHCSPAINCSTVSYYNNSSSSGPSQNQGSTFYDEIPRTRKKQSAEQKRRNHIRHEQRRRRAVKDGLNELVELIPELQGFGLSRSTILIRAADWLEKLVQGNKCLRAQLRVLEHKERQSNVIIQISRSNSEMSM